MERLTKDGKLLSYDKKYFTDEKEAEIFANKVNGNVYPVEFLGGYEVVFQSEQEISEQEINQDEPDICD